MNVLARLIVGAAVGAFSLQLGHRPSPSYSPPSCEFHTERDGASLWLCNRATGEACWCKAGNGARLRFDDTPLPAVVRPPVAVLDGVDLIAGQAYQVDGRVLAWDGSVFRGDQPLKASSFEEATQGMAFGEFASAANHNEG
jgi:hypothetical protein